MNYPYIKAIYYKLKTVEDVSYENCKMLQYDQPEYKFSLDKNILKCELKDHYSDIESACAFINPLLRAWEIDSAISYDREEICFVYDHADIVEYELPSSGPKVATANVHITSGINCEIKANIIRKKYPKRPSNFIADPEVETLWFRYNMYIKGKEPLLSMAYFCFTHLLNLAERDKGKGKRKS